MGKVRVKLKTKMSIRKLFCSLIGRLNCLYKISRNSSNSSERNI